MDYRYIVSGANIVLLSIIFVITGLTSQNMPLVGIALSTLTLGVIVLTAGLTYAEPLSLLLKGYSRALTMHADKILEDTGLIDNHTVRVCSIDNQYYAVFSGSDIDCSKIYPGIGLQDKTPYVAIRLNDMLDTTLPEVLETGGEKPLLQDYLSQQIINHYNICREVIVNENNNNITVTLSVVHREIADTMKHPVNPLRLLIPALVSYYKKKNVVVVDEDMIEDGYVMRLRVIG